MKVIESTKSVKPYYIVRLKQSEVDLISTILCETHYGWCDLADKLRNKFKSIDRSKYVVSNTKIVTALKLECVK